MLKNIIFFIISFILGFFMKEIIDCIERKKKYDKIRKNEKVKKLSDQDFKQAMKDLEIK